MIMWSVSLTTIGELPGEPQLPLMPWQLIEVIRRLTIGGKTQDVSLRQIPSRGFVVYQGERSAFMTILWATTFTMRNDNKRNLTSASSADTAPASRSLYRRGFYSALAGRRKARGERRKAKMIIPLYEQEKARFRLLNEYDLHYTVDHLIAAARKEETQLGTGNTRNVRLIVKLLADPAFALAKADVIGAEETVADFVAGYAAVSISLSSEARFLSQALATAAIVSSLSAKVVLTPEVLNALLTYRADTVIYGEFLEFATDEKFIAEIVPDALDRSWITRAFLHNAATRCRRQGGKHNIDRARDMLRKARNLGDEAAAAADDSKDLRSKRALSSILYDLAYIDYLTGRPSAAREGFRASAAAAERAHNDSGYYMSRILERLVGFYDGAVRASEFRILLKEALGYFTGAVEESPHAERWVQNVHGHLFDLACLTGDVPQADAEFAYLQTDPWVLKLHRFAAVNTWRARCHLAHRGWRQASTLYEVILEEELSQPEENLVREGIARDLLDYGTALAGQGSVDLARRAWERGLQSSDYAAAWPWKPQISRRLAEIDF
jgi:hypothetical protein